MLKKAIASAVMMVAAVSVISAQAPGSSPAGAAQVEIGGKYVAGKYEGGKWMEITYGRPLMRGRDLFAGGPDYGKTLNATAPVWRAGANMSTRLKTAAPIVIGGKTVPAGEYSIFIDLKENNWTFILSSHLASKVYPTPTKDELWGSYGYSPAKDVARAPMKLMKTTVNVEQLTWGFVNITATGGEIAFWWGKEMATVPFTLAP